ncbi:hypothetical protein D3C78_1208980 [compost metagenome]
MDIINDIGFVVDLKNTVALPAGRLLVQCRDDVVQHRRIACLLVENRCKALLVEERVALLIM